MNKPTILAMLLSLCNSNSGRISNIRFSCLRFLRCCLWLFAGLLLAGSPVQAEIKAGDILVLDQVGGTNGHGALFLVNPTTGQRTVFSDFGNPAQGALGSAPASVAVGPAGQIFVTDIMASALFRVNRTTGNRTLISDFGQGDIQGGFYYGLAVDARGRVIANLLNDFLRQEQTVVRINPRTDKRALITNLSNPAQGGPDDVERLITDLALERSGTILIGTTKGDYEKPSAAIFRVNSVTGKRRLLSDFANPTQGTDIGDLFFSQGMAVSASGNILVASGGSVFAPRNLLLRINPTTGRRTILSDFDNPAQGRIGYSLSGVAVEESGKIIVGAWDSFVGTFSLFRVRPKTGQRILLSDSNKPAQGPALRGTTYITVVPKNSNAEGDD